MTAEELILKAAKESGLTKEVALALWWGDKSGVSCGTSVAAKVLSSLKEDFEENITSPEIVVQDMFGDGLHIRPPVSEAEKAEVEAFMR
jgi:hypothetical protein